jgi:branched-chain amino acid transport system substrate-binding protein
VIPSAVNQGVVYLSPNAGPSQLAGRGCHPNYFNVAWQNDNLHEAAGAYANSAGYANSFILAPNYPAGQDALTGYKRMYEGELAGEIYTQLGQVYLTRSLTALPAARATAISYVQVLFAGGWGWLLFGESIDSWTIAGAGLVLAATLVSLSHSQRQKPS